MTSAHKISLPRYNMVQLKKRGANLRYIWLALVIFSYFVMVHIFVRPVRVGDGSEYYALYIAWKETFRPWMSAEALAGYKRLFDSGAIQGLVSPDGLVNAFPALKLGNTFDLNHFWFYSMLAAIVGKLATFVGLSIQPNTSFLALHGLLLFLVSALSMRFYGWKGVAAVFLMAVVSPIFWFVDKVHTEYFTYCLLLGAVILVMNVRYIAAAFLVAIAATQNPSLAIIALFLLFARVVAEPRQTYSFFEVVGIVATILTIFAHPAYYFTRFGVVTPQLLAGGAELGGNLSISYVWFIDPDLGLLPNWPLGFVVLLAGGFVWFDKWRKQGSHRIDISWWAFVAVYLCVCIYTHSSTTNLNSGATPGLARYALWYMPLFFPFFLKFLEWAKAERVRRYTVNFIIFMIFIATASSNMPTEGETYQAATSLSKFIQQYVPRLYNPPPEVFLERFSGYGESPLAGQVSAVVGPDCRKVLLIPGADKHVVAIGSCSFDIYSLNKLVESRRRGLNSAAYITLTNAEIKSMEFTPVLHHVYVTSQGGDGLFALKAGWSGLEGWGVWSDGAQAFLAMPCGASVATKPNIPFSLILKGFAFGPRQGTSLKIDIEDMNLYRGYLDAKPTEIKMSLPTSRCAQGVARIRLVINNPASPFILSGSGDKRMLGVGLMSFSYL